MRASIDLAPHLYWIQRIGNLDPDEPYQTPAMRCCHSLWIQEVGSNRMQWDGRSRVLRPGQVFISDPGLVVTPARGCEVTRAALDLSPRPAASRTAAGKRVVPQEDPQPSLVEIFSAEVPNLVPDPHAGNLVHLLHGLEALWWRSEWDRLRAALNIGHWLLDYVQSCTGEEPHPGYPDTTANLAGRCDTALDALFTKHLTVGDIAARLGVSQAHLTRTYRQARGTTPAKRLAKLRLRGAMAMLANTDHPIEQVVAENGYGNVRALHAAFQRELGEPPGRWRARHRRRPWPRSPA